MNSIRPLLHEAALIQARLSQAIERHGGTFHLTSPGRELSGILDPGSSKLYLIGKEKVAEGTQIAHGDSRFVAIATETGDVCTTITLLKTPQVVEVYDRQITGQTTLGANIVRLVRAYSNLPMSAIVRSVMGKRTAEIWSEYDVREGCVVDSMAGRFIVTAIAREGAVAALTLEPFELPAERN